MSRYYPHPPYAEDQTLDHTILTVHVATRGVTVGSIGGMAVATLRQVIPALRSSASANQPFAARLLRSTATGTLVGVGLSCIGLVGRMWGREKIEWQDRSWRLLENKGQVETDDWTYGGMAAAGGAALVTTVRAGGIPLAERPAVAAMGWRGILGATGLGSVGGMMGYLIWRHGVNGGKFSEKPPKKQERVGI
ncbi:hypothetical protein K4F52_000933 [Lecanicillium sp. MT-2017a]|nr:hypothetical protein K4F52_000933 [Lecanicillium sp. MT-2017a]